MNKLYTAVLLFCTLASCNFLEKRPTRNAETLKAKQSMMDADKAFSKMSEEQGMRKAFMEYIAENGTMLRPGHIPITGAEAVDFITQIDDKNFILTWKPTGADVAASGELGYTYGVYTMMQSGVDSAQHGTYVTIWKKQADGKWKFVLDSGNEGISETQNP